MSEQHLQILTTIFLCFQSDTRVSADTLASQLNITTARVRRILSDLNRVGWLQDEDMRLTMSGLAIAAGLSRRTMQQRLDGYQPNIPHTSNVAA